jgi:hypothetical protein
LDQLVVDQTGDVKKVRLGHSYLLGYLLQLYLHLVQNDKRFWNRLDFLSLQVFQSVSQGM